MPAELDEFDAREWALPGEEPDEAAWMSLTPGEAGADWYRCSRRHGAALVAWFDAHPEADFLDWIRGKRARRRDLSSS
jgi:hypothetical protein